MHKSHPHRSPAFPYVYTGTATTEVQTWDLPTPKARLPLPAQHPPRSGHHGLSSALSSPTAGESRGRGTRGSTSVGSALGHEEGCPLSQCCVLLVRLSVPCHCLQGPQQPRVPGPPQRSDRRLHCPPRWGHPQTQVFAPASTPPVMGHVAGLWVRLLTPPAPSPAATGKKRL